MLKKFLGGRCQQIKAAFFEQVFEACPCLGWAVSKQILRCFLIKTADEDEGGSRSNHQRL